MKILNVIGLNDEALVDDEDWERLSKFKWRDNGYGGTSVRRLENKRNKITTPNGIVLLRATVRAIPLANEVMCDFISVYDHIDRNKLNNQKSNLRKATNSQNNCNVGKKEQPNNSSTFKGVDWLKTHRLWRARVSFQKKVFHIGYFKTEIEAAKAYNEKAKEIQKEFAVLNQIGSKPMDI